MDEKPTEFSILFRQFIEILRRRGLERQVVFHCGHRQMLNSAFREFRKL